MPLLDVLLFRLHHRLPVFQLFAAGKHKPAQKHTTQAFMTYKRGQK